MSSLPHEARRAQIVISGVEKGTHIEGVLATGHAAILPGTWVERKDSTNENGQNRFTWQAFQPGAAAPGLVGILEEDRHQGKDTNVAYVGDDHVFVYVPQKGDELNMLMEQGSNPAGTTIQPKTATGIGEVAVVGNDYPKLALQEDGPASGGTALRMVHVLN